MSSPEDVNIEVLYNKLLSVLSEPSARSVSINGLTLLISTDALKQVAGFIKSHPDYLFDYLSCISGVDEGVEKAKLSVYYHLYSITTGKKLCLKVEIPRENTGQETPAASIPSLTEFWASANWLEREVYDLFGIVFFGHPDLRRILLPADWVGFPLRKDYETQAYYHGVKVDYQ